MGINMFGSSSSYDNDSGCCCNKTVIEEKVVEKKVYFNSTPDPKNFTIMSEETIGDFLIVEINYNL